MGAAARGESGAAGTEGASFPFCRRMVSVSGSLRRRKVKRIAVAGGRPLVGSDAHERARGTWNSDGVDSVLLPASATRSCAYPRGWPCGGADGDQHRGTGHDHRWPRFLPDGGDSSFPRRSVPRTRGIYIGSLTIPVCAGVAGDSAGRFAAPDRLLTTAQGALQVHRFDPVAGAVHGRPAVVAQVCWCVGAMAASATGMLAYRTGSARAVRLVWSTQGHRPALRSASRKSGTPFAPELSADEQSVVVFSGRSGDNDIW